MRAIRHVPISDSLGVGWKKTWEHFGFILSFYLVCILAMIGLGILQGILSVVLAKIDGGMALSASLFGIARTLLNVLLAMAGINAALQILGNKKPTITTVFSSLGNLGLMVNYIVLSVLTGFITFLGFLLFIVPGIYFYLRFSFAGVNLVDKKKGFGEAIRRSGEITGGVKIELFLFDLVAGLVNLIGLLFFGLGLLVTIPMTQLARMNIYKHLMKT